MPLPCQQVDWTRIHGFVWECVAPVFAVELSSLALPIILWPAYDTLTSWLNLTLSIAGTFQRRSSSLLPTLDAGRVVGGVEAKLCKHQKQTSSSRSVRNNSNDSPSQSTTTCFGSAMQVRLLSGVVL